MDCTDFSGADLVQLVRKAAILSVKSKRATGSGEYIVSMANYNEALDSIGPSVSPSLRKKYEAMREHYDTVR
jgi:SpoVK/Ycf46/Vps4 family AAA+-type ATPase